MSKATLAFLIIFIIASLVFLSLFLVYRSQLDNKIQNIAENPFCLRYVCDPGTNLKPVEIPLENDPQKYAYMTLNWCVVNSPPEPYQEAIANCTVLSNEQLTQFATFYLDTYHQRCSYSWKSPKVPTNTAIKDTDVKSPNNPILLNGLNDDLFCNIYKCAVARQIESQEIFKRIKELATC